MFSFTELSSLFEQHFNKRQFPVSPANLYDPAQYILQIGGKRVRPVCVLMGNELFGEIDPDAYHVATAIELFHNFSLIHDDIMDKAPLRRGMETVHSKYGESTALLAGDVMMVQAYDNLNQIKPLHLQKILFHFNKSAKEVCEGQQLDMDFEQRDNVTMEEYVNMITLKTSVLLAGSMQVGAILGGAGEGNQQHIYNFGKNLGIAFQVQDDYLDAFGDPEKFGKQVGGDILSNKKTFLLIHALDVASATQKEELKNLLSGNAPDKVASVLQIFRDCKVDEWAAELKEKYFQEALKNLEDIAVSSSRKNELRKLAEYLLQRES
ncbi:polyprenyl synthetase family protein [Ferruginibacter sp. HRS2-29]|uniref:polyprenyl synthetase family protein n=1 Tax=Ferruginibacter sp. HRS2-29 TaxID=2487334 RepID=UPI0020CF7F68|nr:polyprenyl synthetase family protein [Ferruginibacter sp. HRS2-29]MCP9753421.1 polyprenyl synthetase family protein [Ferruginibacter sp. HRS2-29]